MPAKSASVNMPATISTAPMMRPSRVSGEMSPNPTVVIVTSAHQSASKIELTLGFSFTSTR